MKKILIISSIAVAISFFNISCSNDFESSPMEAVLEEENRTESNSLIDEKARFISSSSSNGNNRRASLSSTGSERHHR